MNQPLPHIQPWCVCTGQEDCDKTSVTTDITRQVPSYPSDWYKFTLCSSEAVVI